MVKIILALLVFLLLPITSNAQEAVFDYQNFLQLVEQLNVMQQQAADLEQALNAIKTLKDNQYQWSDVSEQINELGSVIQSANGISYSAQNANQQFQKLYPGYQSSEDFNQQYQKNMNATMNTLNGVLQSLNMSAQDFANEPKRIAFLQAQLQNAKGQTQAIQASAQISTEVVSQLQLLRQTMMAQANAENMYYAERLQDEASNEAAFDQMIKNGNTHFIPYGSSGHPIQLPDVSDG